MSRKRDKLMALLLMRDNLVAIQLVLISPALASMAGERFALCAAVLGVIFAACGAAFYFLSPSIPQKWFFVCRYLPPALLAGAAALLFMPALRAAVCAAWVLAAELILVSVNDRLHYSGVKPSLRLPAALISALILSGAIAGLRF